MNTGGHFWQTNCRSQPVKSLLTVNTQEEIEMKLNKPFTSVLAGALLVIAACTPGTQLPVTGGTPSPGASGETALTVTPNVAVQAAQQWLAQELNVTVPEVEVVSVEQTEWPDSCLGLGQANESCLQAVTPGWLAVFRVNGQEYKVRTDETGSTVRLVTPSAS
jgi:hypothetical protein